MSIQYLNPDGLSKNPAFSQVVIAEGNGKTIYIGGQNAVNAQGELTGNDLASQTDQAMKNLQTALAAAGADMSHIVKMGVYAVQGQDLRNGFAAAQKYMTAPHPPAISVLIVAGLANPEFLIEIEATAFVPAG